MDNINKAQVVPYEPPEKETTIDFVPDKFAHKEMINPLWMGILKIFIDIPFDHETF